MKSKTLSLKVCRSCVVQNQQSDPLFKDEESLRMAYERKIKQGLFGRVAELCIVDCLTNCENPNSVQIDREDGEILFGRISEENLVDQVVELAKKLKDLQRPLEPSEALKSRCMFTRPHPEWRPGEDAAHADRFRLEIPKT
jgi:predicted metal-binding protein